MQKQPQGSFVQSTLNSVRLQQIISLSSSQLGVIFSFSEVTAQGNTHFRTVNKGRPTN